MPDQILQVTTTTADKGDADKLAQELLNRRLAACVQVTGPMDSSYWWNGRIEKTAEWVCVIKTRRELYSELEKFLLEHHPYDQPEIVAVEAQYVSSGYANWLREQLNPPAAAAPAVAPPSALEPVTPAIAAPQAPAVAPPIAAPASEAVAPAAAASQQPPAPQPASPAGEKRPKRKPSTKK